MSEGNRRHPIWRTAPRPLSAQSSNALCADSDKGGTIYFAAEVAGGAVLLYCLDGTSGVPSGSASLPANTLPEESMRDLVVLDGGGVLQALRTEQGVSYARYDCQ